MVVDVAVAVIASSALDAVVVDAAAEVLRRQSGIRGNARDCKGLVA